MTGIAELNNHIYVAVSGSNQLRVFGSLLFNRRKNLVVKEMKDPWDLAADLTHLYITDFNGRCVWKLKVKGEEDSDDKEKIKVDKWVFEGRPCSLSVTETGQLLVVGGGELTIYSGQGEKLEVVQLKDKGLSDTQHVMQTSPETFLVAHEDRVSLVDRKWKVLKQYAGPAASLQLSYPQHLAEVGAAGHKFVADLERVSVLSPRFELQRTLLLRPSPSEDPWRGWRHRLCYSRSSGQLIVSWGGEHVWVYSVA